MKNIDKVSTKMTQAKEKINEAQSQLHLASDMSQEDFKKLLKRYNSSIKEYDKYFNEFTKLIDYIDKTIQI